MEKNKKEVAEEVDVEIKSDKPPINPQWDKLKNEILGKDFGLNVSYSESGSSIIQVLVPEKKSNAGEFHWGFYHHDIRSKRLSNSDGLDAIKLFFQKIAKNLRIDSSNIVK